MQTTREGVATRSVVLKPSNRTIKMKTLLTMLALPVLLSAIPSSDWHPSNGPRGADDAEEVDVRDLVGGARINLHEAIRKALAEQPGRAVEAELEGERRDGEIAVFFEVLVLSDKGELVELRLSPVDGAVMSRGSAREDASEVREFIAALRHSERTLDQLVTAAETFVKGLPVKTSIGYESDAPLGEVEFVNGRHIIEVAVEGRAGHLVEIEVDGEEAGRSSHDTPEPQREGREHEEEEEGERGGAGR